MPTRLRRCGALLSTILAAGAIVQMAALRAAGLNGSPPPHAGLFQKLISTLTSNWEWLVATGIGLVLILLAGLMVFGDQRAPEKLFRVAGGILVILVVIPAVLS